MEYSKNEETARERRKPPHLFKIEIEERAKGIYVRIETKDPLDALILAHAALFSEIFGTANKRPDVKVLP
jgi:hypothetical protein